MNRLHNLDYLRGLAAFSIMIYHYYGWTFQHLSANSALGRLGIYGVSIFYILSGLTLFYVYENKMLPSKSDITEFFKKRLFRIYPLLILTTFLTVIMAGKFPDLLKLFLNLTGLFGLFSWEQYYATGAWSIGNELVFYLFFPFFILFLKKSKTLFFILSGVLLAIYLYFAFIILNENIALTAQWRNYTNPLNQVFLFLGGFLIGYFFKNIAIPNQINVALFLISAAVFIFYPVEGDQIKLVTNTNRLVFTISCFIACLSVFKYNSHIPSFIHNPLSFLGESSYSVYLVHPIVYRLLKTTLKIASPYLFYIPGGVRLLASIVITLIVSYLTYEYFEKYFMKLGRNKNVILVKNNL